MLCTTCWDMLRGQKKRQFKGTYDLYFDHHDSLSDLNASKKARCSICKVLEKELGRKVSIPEDAQDILQTHFRSRAHLTVADDIENARVFRLDFWLHWGKDLAAAKIVGKKTFVLPECVDKPAYLTPTSDSTDSAEALKLAVSWIAECDRTCQCAKVANGDEVDKDGRPVKQWWPSRLVDIRNLKTRLAYLGSKTGAIRRKQTLLNAQHDVTVRLVDQDPACDDSAHPAHPDHKPAPDDRYVTLSHCWGPNPEKFYRLIPRTEETAETKEIEGTEDELRRGVKVGLLPEAFQDAMRFAAQLHNVRWIWIDALCIMQGDSERAKRDWYGESALMRKVYAGSYLNISATLAPQSDMSLYSNRVPESLWEDEISLNVEGIPGLDSAGVSEGKDKAPKALVDGNSRTYEMDLFQAGGLRRCVLINAYDWDEYVNQAPVNRRGWVLQERLLAPRVLHFCDTKIAWECKGYTRAEGHPQGHQRFQLWQNKVLYEIPMKGLDPEIHGKALKSMRLGIDAYSTDDPVSRTLSAFELWARIVETYSRLDLTKPEDKLVALSGIAALMSEIIGNDQEPAVYVAGLWKKHLESQLLWRVEDVFEIQTRGSDGEEICVFFEKSERPDEYRAPSFSWASVDAQKGKGIVYGAVADRVPADGGTSWQEAEILITVDEDGNACFTSTRSDNPFGLILPQHKAYVDIWCRLRKIKLERAGDGRFAWRLVNRRVPGPTPGTQVDLGNEIHRNVYMDCAEHDERKYQILTKDNIYCVPAAKIGGSTPLESRYLICLLLQFVEDEPVSPADEWTYRRIGLAKLSRTMDKLAYANIDKDLASDIEFHACHWTKDQGHLIRLI